MEGLALCICLAKFYKIVILWSQLNRYFIFLKMRCKKFWKFKLLFNVVTYSVAGKILWSKVIKSEVAESELIFLMKNSFIHAEIYSCE